MEGLWLRLFGVGIRHRWGAGADGLGSWRFGCCYVASSKFCGWTSSKGES
ncbi:hypothetical protein PSE_2185 [Pseudovibrio sp. FO-BEG1]|nr:hypothetical protein PSE_2185 [Pseudovibrio sp. FO-BEG1]